MSGLHLRRLSGRTALRWLWRALFAAALAVPFFWRLDAEEFHGDETHWISSSQQAWYLITTGQWHAAQWRDEFYFYSQPQVGKALIGAALASAGIWGATPISEYDWQRQPWENRALGRVPSGPAVTAARVPGALAGWMTCILLWQLAACAGDEPAGVPAALLLSSHPLWLANARRAGMDTTSLCLGLLAAVCLLAALRAASQAARDRREAGAKALATVWWATGGLCMGLAAGDKYVGLLAVPAALAPMVAALARQRQPSTGVPDVSGTSVEPRTSWSAVLSGAMLAMFLAIGVFWATNPTFFAQPLVQLQISMGFFAQQAADMRRGSPVFGSPWLVAAEIVDRTIWPIGFPAVIDRTLPDALIPGSYGTPIVTLGTVLAILALARRLVAGKAVPGDHLRRQALTWTLVVFVALALSLPIWWERWHLPLVPPLCLLAGSGLAGLARLLPADAPAARRAVSVMPAAAQYVAALAMGASYLGRGFGALALSPVGATVHLLALAVTGTSLVLHLPHVRSFARSHLRRRHL